MFFDVNAEAHRKELHEFYTNNLCEVSCVPAGVLLKDWSTIAGRDESPERSTTIDRTKEVRSSKEEEEEDAMSTDSFVTALNSLESQQNSQAPEPEFNKDKEADISLRLLKLSQQMSGASQTVEIENIFDNSNDSETMLKASPSPELNPSQWPTHHSPFDPTEYSTTQPDSARGRSRSPDMFADDDSDPDNETLVAPPSCSERSSNPALSLDPLSSSGSLEPMTEEDCLIELYSTGAILLEQQNKVPTEPISDVVIESEVRNSLDAQPMQLNYSGESYASFNKSATGSDRIDLQVSVVASDVDLTISDNHDSMGSSDVMELSGNDARQSGIVVFERFDDIADGKCGYSKKCGVSCI